MTGERKPFPFLRTGFNEFYGRFSPDGRWIAYRSNESKRDEVYVASFPGPGGKRQISTTGGNFPRWRRDGKEIFYIGPEQRLMTVEVAAKGDSMEVGAPHSLFGPLYAGGTHPYDISADGQLILAAVPPEKTGSEPGTLVQNWTALLKK